MWMKEHEVWLSNLLQLLICHRLKVRLLSHVNFSHDLSFLMLLYIFHNVFPYLSRTKLVSLNAFNTPQSVMAAVLTKKPLTGCILFAQLQYCSFVKHSSFITICCHNQSLIATTFLQYK